MRGEAIRACTVVALAIAGGDCNVQKRDARPGHELNALTGKLGMREGTQMRRQISNLEAGTGSCRYEHLLGF